MYEVPNRTQNETRSIASSSDRCDVRHVWQEHVSTVRSAKRTTSLLLDLPQHVAHRGSCCRCPHHRCGRDSQSAVTSPGHCKAEERPTGNAVGRFCVWWSRGVVRIVGYSSPTKTGRPRTPSAGPMTPSSSMCSINRAARLYPMRSRLCSIDADAVP